MHLLAAEDWMEAMLFHRNDYNDKFKHTLQHLAREWYHGLDLLQFGGSWHEFTQHFSRYFSTQGRNIKHLHERWRAFSFDPNTDDIEEYIRDVHEAAKQLGHGDDAVLNLLKATMPTELYGTLYGHDNLYIVMAKWLRCSLAEWKVPGSNHHGKSFRKVWEKVLVKKKSFGKKGQLSSACMMEVRMMGVLPNS